MFDYLKKIQKDLF